MQRRYATRDPERTERQFQGGGQRGQYRRDYDDEAMQRDVSAYAQEDEYGTQPSRERGQWQADWSEAGRSRDDEAAYAPHARYERYGSGRDPREADDRPQGGGQNRDAYGAYGASGGRRGTRGMGDERGARAERGASGPGGGRGYGQRYGNDYGRDYEDQYFGDFGGEYGGAYRGAYGDYGGDYAGDLGPVYGRDYGRDYDRDYGSRVSGGGQAYGYGGGRQAQGQDRWQGRPGTSPRGYGSQTTDMRHRQGPKGYSRTDERIREDVCERLCMAHELEVQDVSVQVRDGRVELQGSVPQRWMKHAIEDVADQCFGVQDVENRIRTQSPYAQGEPSRGGTGVGTGSSPHASQPTGTVGTAGSNTVSSAAGSTGSSSGVSDTSGTSGKQGASGDGGKHH
ncbi:transport-associated protein [Pandoraea captiosa]|uniref:Transport-associated protein n=1 Tax=Pandoraea captiosa TaxID=2508302 RepID=A0A5E4ZN93_9BURK|nr:BON domain-containing protein [Pandoraea captiosa]VVE61730.1 transport-associated protein [Pandoraea captiosa]